MDHRATPSTVASTPDVPDIGQKDGRFSTPSPPRKPGGATPSQMANTSMSPSSKGLPTSPIGRSPASKGRPHSIGSPKRSGNASPSKARALMKKSTKVSELDGTVGNSAAKSDQLRLAGVSDGEAGGVLSHSVLSRREPRGPRTLLSRREPSERVGRADRTLVWAACDTFWTFDRSRCGEITRDQYIAQLAEAPTVIVLRMLRKSRLEARFRKSARPVRIEEFLRLIWPSATDKDFETINRWVQLREAWTVLNDRRFHGSDAELRKVWDLLARESTLAEGMSGEIIAREFVRAQILSAEEIERLTRTAESSTRVTQEVFRNSIIPHLKHLYVSSSAKAEEDDRIMEGGLGNLLGKTR